jgi:hypothetical protein
MNGKFTSKHLTLRTALAAASAALAFNGPLLVS